MQITTRPDRAGYRWITLPEPAIVMVEVTAGERPVDTAALTVTAAGAMRSVRVLGRAPSASSGRDRRRIEVGPMAARSSVVVLLEFMPRPAADPGRRTIGDLRLEWTDEDGRHQLGRMLATVVLPLGAARAPRDDRIAEALAALRSAPRRPA